jgi:site-specific recombinase XerD
MGVIVQPTCLDKYFGSFEQSLAPQNYQRRALSLYRYQLRRFGRVIEAEGISPSALTLELADELAKRVPFRDNNKIRIANLVRRFMRHLIEIGVVATPPVTAAQLARNELLSDLESYLLGQRGLSPGSVYQTKRYAIRFLDHRFGDEVPDPAIVSPKDIIAFIEHLQMGKSLSLARTPAGQLRGFFQYLFSRGITPTNLSLCVPKMRRECKARLPRHLPPQDIEAILNWVRRESRHSKRDYAMFLLMARLGLRAPEVLAVRLDDIDWRMGELLVRGKGKRHDRIPIPADVGKAISQYLQDHRPPATTRFLFVRGKAPHLALKNSAIINKILERAYAATGVAAPARYLGSHVLRHSLATGMVRAGVSLDEVGDLLRHRSRATTMIYAKLDIDSLRSVAHSWPVTGDR